MKKKILCAAGAVVVLLGIAAGVIFGSDAPNRLIFTATGEGWSIINERTAGANRKDVDIVIHGDVLLRDVVYHEGDRLTEVDGKLVHQSWLQVRRNDLRYWAYKTRSKLKGED